MAEKQVEYFCGPECKNYTSITEERGNCLPIPKIVRIGDKCVIPDFRRHEEELHAQEETGEFEAVGGWVPPKHSPHDQYPHQNHPY